MQIQEFISLSRLDEPTLNRWVEAGWLAPAIGLTNLQFSELDLARARLIQDLRLDFEVNDEGIAIVLHLLDQLHGLRSLLRSIRPLENKIAGKSGD